MRLHTPLALLAALALPGPAPAADPLPTALTDYVGKKDDSFAWKLAGKTESDAGAVYELDLVSQTWQGVTWDHKLQVFVPKGAKPQPTMVLWNQGGLPSVNSGLLGLQIAERVKAPVAFLYGVPKQPLYADAKSGKLGTAAPDPARPRDGALVEDALIAETFVKYLETKDATWPLLFPMVKSVVKAMDALQAFAKQEWKFDVASFVVTGASKRGWTSWLTAATGDKRVKAIAPIVIDTLNLPVQMGNQVKAFGRPSEMINDYTERKLVPIPDTAEAKALWRMIDPYTYRDRLTRPKLIVNGANDPYWPLDALNSYWDDLKGDKWVLYVPNAGHDLRETDKDGKKELLPLRAVNTLAAFCYCQVFDKKMPTLGWKYADADGAVRGEISHDGRVVAQRQWTAAAKTRDFRGARWAPAEHFKFPPPGNVLTGVNAKLVLQPPAAGFRADFVEAEFTLDGLSFNLSTQLRILEAKK